MSSISRNDPDRLGAEQVPPFWIPEGMLGERQVDPLVIQASRENWPWAYWLVARQLPDGGRAGEIVEDVAVYVTRRFLCDSEVGRNLSGYYRTALIRRVQTIAIRESRIVYEGTARDVESNHQLSAPD